MSQNRWSVPSGDEFGRSVIGGESVHDGWDGEGADSGLEGHPCEFRRSATETDIVLAGELFCCVAGTVLGQLGRQFSDIHETKSPALLQVSEGIKPNAEQHKMVMRAEGSIAILTDCEESHTSRRNGFPKPLEEVPNMFRLKRPVGRHMIRAVCESDKDGSCMTFTLQENSMRPKTPQVNSTGQALPTGKGLKALNKGLFAVHMRLPILRRRPARPRRREKTRRARPKERRRRRMIGTPYRPILKTPGLGGRRPRRLRMESMMRLARARARPAIVDGSSAAAAKCAAAAKKGLASSP